MKLINGMIIDDKKYKDKCVTCDWVGTGACPINWGLSSRKAIFYKEKCKKRKDYEVIRT